jgi:hypothetical protein
MRRDNDLSIPLPLSLPPRAVREHPDRSGGSRSPIATVLSIDVGVRPYIEVGGHADPSRNAVTNREWIDEIEFVPAF